MKNSAFKQLVLALMVTALFGACDDDEHEDNSVGADRDASAATAADAGPRTTQAAQ
jgi:hypothetical protein